MLTGILISNTINFYTKILYILLLAKATSRLSKIAHDINKSIDFQYQEKDHKFYVYHRIGLQENISVCNEQNIRTHKITLSFAGLVVDKLVLKEKKSEIYFICAPLHMCKQ